MCCIQIIRHCSDCGPSRGEITEVQRVLPIHDFLPRCYYEATCPWRCDWLCSGSVNSMCFMTKPANINSFSIVAKPSSFNCYKISVQGTAFCFLLLPLIGVLIEDTKFVDSCMGGKPWKAGKFSSSLRLALWSEHLGLPAGEKHLFCL